MGPADGHRLRLPSVQFADRAALLDALGEQDQAFDWEGVITSYREEVRYRLTRRYERELWERAAAPWLIRRRWRGRPTPTRRSVLARLPTCAPGAISYVTRAVSGADGAVFAEIIREVPARMPSGPVVRYTPRWELLSELEKVKRSPTARAHYEEHRLLADRPMPPVPAAAETLVGRVMLGEADVAETVTERYLVVQREAEGLEERSRRLYEAAVERLALEIDADASKCDEEDEQRGLSGSIADQLNLQ